MKKIIVIIIVLALLGIVAWGVNSLLNNRDTNDTPTVSDERQEAIDEDNSRPLKTLNVKHQYADGEHIFVGTFDLPSPCHSFNAEVVEGESLEIKITTASPEEGTVCAAVIEKRDFKVVYKGAENAKFIITVDGEPYNLNLFEISLDKNIDTVELYIKG